MTDETTPSGDKTYHYKVVVDSQDGITLEGDVPPPLYFGHLDHSGHSVSGGTTVQSNAIEYGDVLRLFKKLREQTPRRFKAGYDYLELHYLRRKIRRRWASRAFASSLRGWGFPMCIYYPPAPLPHALVHKSNPMRRAPKSARLHARRVKQAKRK